METKTCTKCAQTKPRDAFYPDKKQSSGLRPDCKECRAAANKTKYQTDTDYRSRKLTTASEYQKGQRREYQIRILTLLKNAGCIDCGETDPIVLDFDHQRDKVAGVSALVRSHRNWEVIAAEIEKCVVRCSNCHRRKTAKDRKYYADIDLTSL